jgi:hypothetical protein
LASFSFRVSIVKNCLAIVTGEFIGINFTLLVSLAHHAELVKSGVTFTCRLLPPVYRYGRNCFFGVSNHHLLAYGE